MVEEEMTPYGAEYYSTVEREYIGKLLEILRCSNKRAVLGIKINIDVFHHAR